MDKALTITEANSLVIGSFVLHSKGMTVEGSPTFEEWEKMGRWLSQAEGAVHFWLGDWVRYGEHRWGEKYAQAMDATSFAYQTIANDAWVASQVDISRRRENLPFSLHAEIASLPSEEQERWLDRAETGNGEASSDGGVKPWTRAELRKELRIEKDTQRQAGAVPVGQYRVILADPPWSYSNSGFTQSAEAHYPTMPIADLCQMRDKLAPCCIDDTVLFLWATSPLLPDAFSVITAWGFEYKASMVWDKGQAPGIGWFVRTEHELLLIATRAGNLHPLVRPGSMIRMAPSSHSAKPDEAYEIIEQMYYGPYLELFLRGRARDGWQGWGNEAAE